MKNRKGEPFVYSSYVGRRSGINNFSEKTLNGGRFKHFQALNQIHLRCLDIQLHTGCRVYQDNCQMKSYSRTRMVREYAMLSFTICTKPERCWQKKQMALFHCMVRHGTVRYDSLLGGFPLGTVPGTFFSTTSPEVPSKP